MPIGAQPSGRRGTVGHPYSALNLRLVLALFGLVTSLVFAVVLLMLTDVKVFGWIFVALAVIAAVDLVVVQLRRRARNRAGGNYSLFE
jgi:uncharacterized membrane protein